MDKRILEAVNFINNSKDYTLLNFNTKGFEYLDKEGYKYSKMVNGKVNTIGKYDNRNKYLFENIDKMLNNESILVKDTYKSSKEPCVFICCSCRKEYESTVLRLSKRAYKGCSQCAREKQQTKLSDYDRIKKEIEDLGYTLLDKKFNGVKTRINVEDKNGYKGKVQIYTLRHGGGIPRFALYNPYALENIKKFIKDMGYDCEVPNQKYKGYGKPLKVICQCGKQFNTTVDNLVYGNKTRCNKCTNRMSKLEQKVKDWIDELGIDYIEQKRFPDCYYKKTLPFDFYLPNENICIEVQGEQHYRIINFQGNKHKAEKAFELLKKRDDIKRKYCLNKNIMLIELKYDVIRNSKENIIKKILSKK